MQKDHVTLEFLHGHRGVIHPWQLARQRSQFVVVGREKRAAAVRVMQMFQRRPCDGQPVIGRGAAPDFVQDHQRMIIGLIQDRGSLDHLDHKGGPPPRQIVRRPNATEQLAHQSDLGPRCRHETAHLRQQRDQRDLSQKGGLARHIRPGQQPDIRPIAQVAVIGHERNATLLAQGLFHNRMPPAFDQKTA